MSGFRNFGTMLGQGFQTPGLFDRTVEETMRAEAAMDRARMTRDQAVERENILESLKSSGMDPQMAQRLAAVMRAGFANYQQGTAGEGNLQIQGFRDQIVNPENDVATMNRYRAGIGASPFNPLQSVGTGQYTDVMAEQPQVMASPLGQSMIDRNDAQARSVSDRAAASVAATRAQENLRNVTAEGRQKIDEERAGEASARAQRTKARTPGLGESVADSQSDIGGPSTTEELLDMGLAEALAEIDRQSRAALASGRGSPAQIGARAAELRRQAYERYSEGATQ